MGTFNKGKKVDIPIVQAYPINTIFNDFLEPLELI
jgi:hypothetical protein